MVNYCIARLEESETSYVEICHEIGGNMEHLKNEEEQPFWTPEHCQDW